MELKRIEIFGFKSFAKKLDLKLIGGITAIVGPNGCGKTNIVDAIRWVLGEQRPTQIRLDRMEDVLFKGSNNRRQLGMAEVNLTIDNDSGLLPLGMPEITITRRLFRTGESDYMINKKSCRLADINDLFMDTGMGTDSYSMFEQNMINSILSDKAEDRRHIFEEAAGVTKYKARRKSAMMKLSSINDDLERVGDIIIELERRAESLKRQASKAIRYRKLKTEIRERTIAIAASEFEHLKAEIKQADSRLETLKVSSESHRTKSAQLTAESEQLSVDILNVEKELAENAGNFTANLASISEQEKELARLESQLEYLDEKAERAREESRRTAASLEKLAESHGHAAENLAKATERLAEVEKACGEHEKRYGEFVSRVHDRSEAGSALEKEYHRVEREQAEQHTALESVRLWGENGEKRLQEIIECSDEVEKTFAEAETRLERLRGKKQEAAVRERKISERIVEMKESLVRKAEELEETDARLRELRQEEASLRAERDFLAEIVRTCAGYSEGVRNAVGSDRLKGVVLGVLGDAVSTDDEYLKAVKAALETRLQNILVNSGEDALAGVRYLSEDSLGRATFLPLDFSGNIPQQFQIPPAKGLIGPAIEVVRTDERFKPVIRRLLAGVFIVDTIETALKLQGTLEGATFVTLDGEKAGRWGDLQGGGLSDEDGDTTIGRREHLEKLTAAYERITAEIEACIENREVLSNEADYLRGSIREQENAREALRHEIQELKSEEAHTSAKKDAAQEMLSNWTAEAERIKGSFHGYKEETEMLGNSISIRDRELKELGDRLRNTAEELNELKTELEKSRLEVNEYSIERAALTEKKASLDREIRALGERREALAQSSNRMLEEIDNTEREILEVGRKKSAVMEKIEELSSIHQQIQNQKDETERRHAELASKRSEIERNLQNIRRELAELSQRESTYVLQSDQASMRMKAVVERLENEFFVSEKDILRTKTDPDFDPEQEKLALDDLRRKVQNIGDVNMAAEADYQEEKKRLDFLKSESNDLVEAQDTIVKTISKINHIARSRFTETFTLIRLNFHKTFRDFFDGGICDLEMEQDEDPLEAKILITACPPGKNVRSINLLSSGERALTAIALLFAIYQVKPSPFCILDEVDAPLDDANIDRFLRVIRRFSKTTQFIIVTHNKKTMAAADNLYGITMEEPGLSSLVSVRLSQVDALREGKPEEKEKEVSVE